jgi:glycosyltransferase involved in cell wall biosynthesis
VLSKYGELNKYVEDKGIGYSLEPASIAEALIKIKKDCLEDNLTIPKDYTFSYYSIPNISKSLLSIIKQ